MTVKAQTQLQNSCGQGNVQLESKVLFGGSVSFEHTNSFQIVEFFDVVLFLFNLYYNTISSCAIVLEVKLPYEPVCLSVGWSSDGLY